jgi:hypothetical protein
MDSDIMAMRELADYLKINEKTAHKFAAEVTSSGFKVGGARPFR